MAEIAASASAPHAPDGSPRYPGTCRRLSTGASAARIAAGERFALRLDMAAALVAAPGPLWFEEEGEGAVACDPASFGDVVLARKDAPASYHLCVTHDDALQGVTLVTRGEDLKPATHLHRLLQALRVGPPALRAPPVADRRVRTPAGQARQGSNVAGFTPERTGRQPACVRWPGARSSRRYPSPGVMAGWRERASGRDGRRQSAAGRGTLR